ncbi:MAG: M23 family metallopeptidase [Myxococcota bacterium]
MIALLVGVAFGQHYAFPTSSSDYSHWYLSTYVDNNGQDYACGSDRYSGHTGTDFGAGSWSGMSAGRDVNAAARGTVVYVHDGEPDNCANNCSTIENMVQVRHPDNRITAYAHLKRWSITVNVGDSVSCGEKLGEMGSSGNSSAPHLHFGVYENGDAVDPFEGPCGNTDTRWMSQGSYQGIPGLVCDTSGGGGGSGCGSLAFSGHLALMLLVPPALLRRRRR